MADYIPGGAPEFFQIINRCAWDTPYREGLDTGGQATAPDSFSPRLQTPTGRIMRIGRFVCSRLMELL